MRGTIALVLSLFFTLISFAHRGNFLAINDVEVKETEHFYEYHFTVENIHKIEVTDVKIEFVVNAKSIFQRYYPLIKSSDDGFREFFKIPKLRLNPDRHFVQIEITEIFDIKADWGGWDSPNMQRQANTLQSDQIVEAPWRMPKSNEQGELNEVPVHVFIHDADLVTGFTLKVDYINIFVKNAIDGSFGDPLTFDTVSSVDFIGMFNAASVADANLDIQEFEESAFVSASDKTILFNEESDFFDEYESITGKYWFFNFNIPATVLDGMEDIIDIKVVISYANTLFTDDEFGLRVFRSVEDIPTQAHFYRGDTHLHSMYTQNDAEIGLPLEATKIAAKHIGMDWITTTDHTSDFDNYGDGNILTNWDRIQWESEQLNMQDNSMIYIPGQEVAVMNAQSKLVHLLAYPNMDDPMGLPFLGDGDGDVSSTAVTVDNVLTTLDEIDGFSYAAHPFATEDKLPLVPVDGGIWNLGDASFPDNSEDFPKTGGNIICNDPGATSDVLSPESNKLVKDGLKGAQIWNHRASLGVDGTSGGDDYDAFDVNLNSMAMSNLDTTSMSYHFNKFKQGQEIVNHINMRGLLLKNQDSGYLNWKLYYAAGADAHGSFNFSNTGNFAGFGGIDNNAVGKLNTVVYCPSGMGVNGSGVLKGLYNGNSTMSDGPLLTIGLSDNGDDLSNEILMGEDTTVDVANLDSYYLNYHFTTSEEFGEMQYLRFILGTDSLEHSINWPIDTLLNYEQSIQLGSILDSLGFSTARVDEYVYLRAEVKTHKEYGDLSAIYLTSYEDYHSITNPIWFKIGEVQNPVAGEFDVMCHPNPFYETYTLTISNPGSEDVVLSWYDELGRILYSEKRIVQGVETVSYNAIEMGLAKGMYTIRATTGDQKDFVKVVKL